MNIETILKEKEPPKGGLLRLRARIRERELAPTKQRRILGFAAAALVIAMILMGLPASKPAAYEHWLRAHPEVGETLGIQRTMDTPVGSSLMYDRTLVKTQETDRVVILKIVGPSS
jgi:hypothetical protein